MGTLQIPETFVPGFLALASMPPEQFDHLAEALGGAPLAGPQVLAERVVAAVPELDIGTGQAIVASLASLFGYHRRAHESLAEVASGVAESPALDDLQEEPRQGLADRVKRLLSTRAISGTAKAADLQHHRHAVSAVQVVTETRFLFDEEDLEPAELYGAVISHTLRIQTLDDDRDTVFTMTDGDVHALQAELDRALKKREMIYGRLRSSGFVIYADHEEDLT